MLNNKGFSNILVISIVLVLLGVGGYFTYNYLQKLNEAKENQAIPANEESLQNIPTPATEENTQPDKTTSLSFIIKQEDIFKCDDGGDYNKSGYYEIELTENNKKIIIGGPVDSAYLLNNQIYYTYENPREKTFSIYKIDSNFETVKLRDFMFDGINPTSNILIEDDVVFILNTDQLYKFNLTKLTEKKVSLTEPFYISTQLKGREFIIRESRKNKKCAEGYGFIPRKYQVWNVDSLKLIKNLNNAIQLPDSEYLEQFSYQYNPDDILNKKVIYFKDGVFKQK
jgi:hypothetical protein